LLATARSRLAPGRHPADAVQIPFRTGPVWTPLERVLARCRAVGARLDVFTVNDARLAREFVALGVDGLMTDDPAQIARALGRRTPAEAGADLS
jgi:glycerophosphoryl diester phosphodiesterase